MFTRPISEKTFFVGLLIAIVLAASAITVKANPSFFVRTVQTATATSTIAYMTPGNATSTLIYDSYAQGTPRASDSALLLTQFTASTTASNLAIALEYSNGDGSTDCSTSPGLCDWYKDNLFTITNASTTQATNIAVASSLAWNFASSSQGGAAVLSTNQRALKAILVPMPTRYVRAVFTITGANGAVWAQIVPKRESN
jgi:hypothetical protein